MARFYRNNQAVGQEMKLRKNKVQFIQDVFLSNEPFRFFMTSFLVELDEMNADDEPFEYRFRASFSMRFCGFCFLIGVDVFVSSNSLD